ncbi:MAG: hypothetical protein PHY92_01455 [Alphaproteobacteria bacterium]|nr:hypothetical protein [Alphaproteobacteria bacterium]
MTIPPVSATNENNLSPVKGNYAAMVQSGGWNLKVESQGFACGAWTFDTDVNSCYVNAMQEALKHSVEKIDFTPDTYSPEQLKEKGYDAQIVIYQGNADSKFSIAQNFFSVTANSEIALALTVAITDKTGLVKQYSVDDRGTGSEDSPPIINFRGCALVNDAIAKAGQTVVQRLVQKTVLLTRDGLRERAEKKTAQK